MVSLVSELLARKVYHYSAALLILNIELVVLGVLLCAATFIFVSLQTRVFEEDFKEEQRFFINSMISLLIVYTVRFMNMLLINMYQNDYLDWMDSEPTLVMTIQMVCHVFYDAFPVVQILTRHKKTFSKEEDNTTTVVMTCSERDTSIIMVPT